MASFLEELLKICYFVLLLSFWVLVLLASYLLKCLLTSVHVCHQHWWALAAQQELPVQQAEGEAPFPALLDLEVEEVCNALVCYQQLLVSASLGHPCFPASSGMWCLNWPWGGGLFQVCYWCRSTWHGWAEDLVPFREGSNIINI